MVGTIESRPLASKVMKATHPLHGELTVVRQSKAENENQLTFSLTLVQPDGETIEDSHDMFVTRSARSHPNESAVGYNYIDLDEGFQGKGVGYVLHAAAAEAAVELDARHIVIDDVSTDAMFGFCRQTGMKENYNSYSLSPPLAEEAFKNKAAYRGWTLS
jgi:GNAT superfamily N-acetyltransferase